MPGTDWGNFGCYSLTKEIFDKICGMVPVGGTIFELGSGWVSGEFVRAGYKVYSVEDNNSFLYQCEGVNYIFAPIDQSGWYSVDRIKEAMVPYDLLIVDGPVLHINRPGIVNNLDLFDPGKTVLIDDAEIGNNEIILKSFEEFTGRPRQTFDCGVGGTRLYCIF